MKTIIKIAVSVVVVISSFSIQSCQKEETKITPVQTPPPAPVNKNTIIGKWRAVKGTTTIEREFIKGADENHGTGNTKVTTTNPGNSVTVNTEPFKWAISGNNLELKNSFNLLFPFQLSEDGNRLIIFSDADRRNVSFTFERIN